ncbi:MAG: hypothetical protein R6W72_01270 [Desulfurivibrionaceae bacterium]
MIATAGTKTITLLAMLILLSGLTGTAWGGENCQPTPYDEMGPFYRPDAPVRSSVGQGYLLEGTVRSAEGCKPLPAAVIEFWLTNEQGDYDDAHRATVIADQEGKYSFASNRPTHYVGRLPHIHIRVTAAGHQELITQHYPEKGEARADFDLVLRKTEE